MPDLLTHTLIVFPLKPKISALFPVLLLGTILPDVVSRLPTILLPNTTNIIYFQLATHSPSTLLITCLLLCLLFPIQIRKKILGLLLIGTCLHLFLDLFQRTLLNGYWWFFPISFKSFCLPLIWPNDSIYVVPFLIVFNIAIEWFKLHKKEKKNYV